MPTTTGAGALPSPLAAEAPDGPGALLALAQRLALIHDPVATVGALPGTGLYPGQRVPVLSTPGAVWEWDGAAWKMTGRPTFATTGARDAAIASPVLGMECLIGGIVYRYGTSWPAWSSDWITYAPTLTNLVVGTGGSAGTVAKYRYVDGEVEVFLTFTLGTSGASVGTNPIATLPVTVASPPHANAFYTGGVSLFDASGAARPGFIAADPVANRIRLYQISAAVGQAYDSITATAPWTWAAGDALHARFWVSPA